MVGYDDVERIGAVRDMMRADTTISRRQAIIAVAGEGSLRRIERKMAATTEAGGKAAAPAVVPASLAPPATDTRRTRRSGISSEATEMTVMAMSMMIVMLVVMAWYLVPPIATAIQRGLAEGNPWYVSASALSVVSLSLWIERKSRKVSGR